MWVTISEHNIYFYKEYACGGKVWDLIINLQEEFTDRDITAKELEEVINNHF